MSASEKAAARERKLRDNGIPVSLWGDDLTLMVLYQDEFHEVREDMAQNRLIEYEMDLS